MPGVRCRVDCCHNTIRGSKNKDISFHKFPKNPTLRKTWMKFTRKPGSWNPDNSYICSDHFAPEEFVRNLQAELLQIPARRRVLKKTAVPTVFDIHLKPSEVKQKRIKRYEERERKRIVDELLAESEREEKLEKDLEKSGIMTKAPQSQESKEGVTPSSQGEQSSPAYGLYLLGGPPYSVIAQPLHSLSGSRRHPNGSLLISRPHIGKNSILGSSSHEIIVKKVVEGSHDQRQKVLSKGPIILDDPLSPSSCHSTALSPPPKPQPVILLPGASAHLNKEGLQKVAIDLLAQSKDQTDVSPTVYNGGAPPPLIELSCLPNKLPSLWNSQGALYAQGVEEVKMIERDDPVIPLRMKISELTNDLKNKNKLIREQRAKIKKLATDLVRLKKDKQTTAYVIESLAEDDPPVICCDHSYALSNKGGKQGKGSTAKSNCDQPFSPRVSEASMMYVLPCDQTISPIDTNFLLETHNVVVERIDYT